MTEIRLASAEDAETAGRILAAGFEDDPVLSWAMSDPGRRAKLEALFGFAVRTTFAPATYLDDDGAVAAAWLPTPGQRNGDEAEALEMGAALLEAGATAEDLDRLIVLGETMDAVHPAEPHWYLGMIATLPDRRSEGLGSALLAHCLRIVDAEGVPAYLESSNPRNLGLYERHGFVATGRIDLPDGVFMTPMWREAR